MQFDTLSDYGNIPSTRDSKTLLQWVHDFVVSFHDFFTATPTFALFHPRTFPIFVINIPTLQVRAEYNLAESYEK